MKMSVSISVPQTAKRRGVLTQKRTDVVGGILWRSGSQITGDHTKEKRFGKRKHEDPKTAVPRGFDEWPYLPGLDLW